MKRRLWIGLLTLLFFAPVVGDELGEHGFAQNGDVKIHYVTAGEGPLVVMIHGFPDYWYTWRAQMPALAKNHKVVAIDQRGYNKSSQPEGVENYAIDRLVSDVRAVINHFKQQKAIIVGHDWGGFVAWSFAMAHPEMTSKLVILNIPHPWALQRELATNPTQEKNSQYARDFQKPEAASNLTAFGLAFWVKDKEARDKYVEAFERSSFEAMLNYYKANYPKPPYAVPDQDPPPIRCPVLMLHGMKDKYLLPGGLDGTWKWVREDLTLVTIPDAAHFIQQEKPELVTSTIVNWLNR
ncbi:MAG: alpha/beta hydrolase [Planctomycetota bacterium]